MPSLLAVDPGDTTGWVQFRDLGGAWAMSLHGQTTAGVPPLPWDGLRVVVVEAIPEDKGTPAQHRAYQQAMELARSRGATLHIVAPSQWKPWARARGVKKEARDPEGERRAYLKDHALDAYCMGRYVLWRHYERSHK